MQHSADYSFRNRTNGEHYVLRFHRGIATAMVSEADFRLIAKVLLLLFLKVSDIPTALRSFDADWDTTCTGVFVVSDRYDMDSNSVIEQVGRESLLKLSAQFEESIVGKWLVQEADLLE